jgi:hypothetical protein
MNKELNPTVFLPYIWFFLYSVAHCYPDHPNNVTKRKYYDFIQNLPLFVPNSSIQKRFISILDTFPVTPYLDNKDSFTYWVHFIENKLNHELGLPEMTYLQHLDYYYNHYSYEPVSISKKWKVQKKYIVWFILAICFSIIIYYS